VSKEKISRIISGSITRFVKENNPESETKNKEEASKPSKPVNPKENEGEACDIEKAFLDDRLKSPSTAGFPWREEGPDIKVAYIGNGEFRVLGYADSGIDFNEMTKIHFICES